MVGLRLLAFGYSCVSCEVESEMSDDNIHKSKRNQKESYERPANGFQHHVEPRVNEIPHQLLQGAA